MINLVLCLVFFIHVDYKTCICFIEVYYKFCTYEVCSNSIQIGIVVVVHWVGCVCNQS